MSLATIAMAIWFGMYALLSLTNVEVKNQQFIMGILAAIVCVLLFVGDRTWWRRNANPVVG